MASEVLQNITEVIYPITLEETMGLPISSLVLHSGNIRDWCRRVTLQDD